MSSQDMAESTGKRVDASSRALNQEIATLQRVLAIQQKETSGLQEQVNLLECELEEYRKICEKRQKQLNHANDKIADRDSKIKNLEEKLQAAKVEGKAFEKFSSQNKMLLESYLAEQKESEKAKEELDKVSFHAKNLRESVEARAKELTVKESEYTAQIRNLKQANNTLSKEKNILEDTIRLQKTQIAELHAKLKLNDELRSDEVARSRQSEYKTLLRAEMTALELQKVSDEKEMLSESINMSDTRARTLDERLNKASNAAHENEEMLHAFVAKAEENSNSWRVEERKLRKENDALMSKLSTMKQAMRNVTQRNQSLEEKTASQVKYIKRLRGRMQADGSSRMAQKFNNKLSKSLNHSLNQSFDTDNNSDNLSTGADSTIYLESSQETGLQQSSLLSVGDESTMHSSDMYKSLDTMQYQGKRSLLAKHLRHVVTLYNTMSVPESLKGKTLDLARCALTDDDMTQVIDWMRLMSFQSISYLDLRSNLLSGKGCLLLAAYLLSLDSDEMVQREETLEINCQHNMVSGNDIPNILSYLIRTTRPDIKYADTEREGQVVVVYGQNLKPHSTPLIRWNFEFNKKSPNI